jgi:hypothetical protein
MQYDEIRIRYWPVGHDQYFVLANGARCAGATIDVAGARDFRAELNDLLRRQFRREFPGDGEKTVEAGLRELGSALCEAIFPPPVRDCVLKSRRKGRGLRVRFDLPPKLATLPIEILMTPGGFLALDRNCSIVRSHSVGGINPVLSAGPEKKPLNVAVASACPRRYQEINASQESADIASQLQFAVDTKVIAPVKCITHATRESLKNALKDLDGETIVVLICHGEYDEKDGQGYVILEDANGDADRVSETILPGLLQTAGGIGLVVLNLCKGAQSNPYDPLSGVAGRLIGVGIPMVIAFQFEVSNGMARQFSPRLLLPIVARASLDEACTEARYFGQTSETTIEWCTPMLHLHRDCIATELIPPLPEESATPEAGTLEEARLALESRRLKHEWSPMLNAAGGAIARFPELKDLHREAWVEEHGVAACRGVAQDLAQRKVVLRRVEAELSWRYDEPDPFQELKTLAATHAARREQEKIDDWYSKAIAREAEGDFAGAAEFCKDVLKLDPGHKEAAARLESELDVLISYATADRELVQPIVNRLTAAGHKVWFDRRPDRVSESLIRRCRHILVCFSDDYPAAPAPAGFDPAKTIVAVVRSPLRIAAAPALRIVPWIDLSDPDCEDAFRRLETALAARATELPFAFPSEIRDLQELPDAYRAVNEMRCHARDVYAFLYATEKIGGSAPDDATALAQALTRSDRLPRDVRLHVKTIEDYAPLVQVRGMEKASIVPALNALYALADWTSKHYNVHGDREPHPEQALWRRLSQQWTSALGARLPNSNWELAEGWNETVAGVSVHKARNVDNGESGDLMLMRSQRLTEADLKAYRSLEASSPLGVRGAVKDDAGGAHDWLFLVIDRPEGCTLEDLKKRFEPLPESVALAAARQAASAYDRLSKDAPKLADGLFRYPNVVLDREGAARIRWNWGGGAVAGGGGWKDLRAQLCAALEGIAPDETISKLRGALNAADARELLAPATAQPGERQHILKTAVECWFEKNPLPAWITTPPPPPEKDTQAEPEPEAQTDPQAETPPPQVDPPRRVEFRLIFEIPIDCASAWPLDDEHIVASQATQPLTVLDAKGRQIWRDGQRMQVRRAAVSEQGLALGGWRGELRWFSAGRVIGINGAGWTIGDIREYHAQWLAGSWNGRLQMLHPDGSVGSIEPAPEHGVHCLAVSNTQQWAFLSMNGAVSVYEGETRLGYPQQLAGARSIAFAGGRVVVLTDQGLVTVVPGQKAGRPEKLPARGELRLVARPAEEVCLLVNETGRSWQVERTGTYPAGPKLPASPLVSAACEFRRVVYANETGGYAYWRDGADVRSWPEAVSASMSAEGRRIVVALPGKVEVYEDPL